MAKKSNAEYCRDYRQRLSKDSEKVEARRKQDSERQRKHRRLKKLHESVVKGVCFPPDWTKRDIWEFAEERLGISDFGGG
jgi:hypothetical protein